MKVSGAASTDEGAANLRQDLAFPFGAGIEPHVDADLGVDLARAKNNAAAVGEVGRSNAGLLLKLAPRRSRNRPIRWLDLAAKAVPSERPRRKSISA